MITFLVVVVTLWILKEVKKFNRPKLSLAQKQQILREIQLSSINGKSIRQHLLSRSLESSPWTKLFSLYFHEIGHHCENSSIHSKDSDFLSDLMELQNAGAQSEIQLTKKIEKYEMLIALENQKNRISNSFWIQTGVMTLLFVLICLWQSLDPRVPFLCKKTFFSISVFSLGPLCHFWILRSPKWKI